MPWYTNKIFGSSLGDISAEELKKPRFEERKKTSSRVMKNSDILKRKRLLYMVIISFFVSVCMMHCGIKKALNSWRTNSDTMFVFLGISSINQCIFYTQRKTLFSRHKLREWFSSPLSNRLLFCIKRQKRLLDTLWYGWDSNNLALLPVQYKLSQISKNPLHSPDIKTINYISLHAHRKKNTFSATLIFSHTFTQQVCSTE